ncbi:hypothetical protein GQ600_21993 [Phytophthora cactorum]|nr:hypothetical protein GQ600_21993 [Phytophthora cactorum]
MSPLTFGATLRPSSSRPPAPSSNRSCCRYETQKRTVAENRNNKRSDRNTDEEERAGITDVAKKFGAGTSQWFKDKTLATKLKFKATQMNLDKTVQKLVEKDTNPDRVYTVLKLHKDSNRYVGWGVQRTGEFRLWEELTAAWKVKYPGWTSQLK